MALNQLISVVKLSANQNTGIRKKEKGNLSNCIVDFLSNINSFVKASARILS